MAAIRCCRISISKRTSCCSCTCCDDFYTRERPPSSSRSSGFCHFMPSSSSVTNFSFNFNLNFMPSSLHRSSPTPRRRRVTYVPCLQAKSSNSPPPLFTPRQQFSQREDDHEYLSEGSVSVTGGIVALGKFDALHIGHRELAIQASKVGIPFLLSFVGMAEVLGWELRAPIVAKCDRKRVLSSWSAYCGSIPPAECHVEFSSVRHLSPREFVEKLAKELGVRGVVAGENYRFGYRAAGDASELVKLCDEYGIGAYIVGSVMDKHQPPRVGSSLDAKDKGQVSSTRVRCALAEGDIKYVSELLGRVHRLILRLSEQEGFTWQGNRISIPKSCLLNLPPKEGLYENCRCIIGDTLVIPCTTVIDTTHIHIESNQQIPFQEYRVIGIEFGVEGDC